MPEDVLAAALSQSLGDVAAIAAWVTATFTTADCAAYPGVQLSYVPLPNGSR